MKFENWTIEDLIARCTDFDEMTLEMDREEFAALRRKITELKQAGNSPVIPDGYVLVPKSEALEMAIAGGEVYAQCESVGEHQTDAARKIWREMVEVAPQEVK